MNELINKIITIIKFPKNYKIHLQKQKNLNNTSTKITYNLTHLETIIVLIFMLVLFIIFLTLFRFLLDALKYLNVEPLISLISVIFFIWVSPSIYATLVIRLILYYSYK